MVLIVLLGIEINKVLFPDNHRKVLIVLLGIEIRECECKRNPYPCFNRTIRN